MRRSPLRVWRMLLIVLALGLMSTPPVLSQARRSLDRRAAARSAPDGTLTLNQKRMQIDALVKRVGEALGRTIILNDDVRGTVSIVTTRPVTHDEAWAILESSLSMLGFTLLPSTVDNWITAKISDAVGQAPFRATARSEGESFITTLIPLEYATLQDVMAVLEPISGSRVTLVPFEPTHSLIASGPERAIARLAGLSAELDRVEELALRIRVLRYRDIGEVEPLVQSFVESFGAREKDVQVWTDERSNSIVVRGRQETVDRVLGFVETIDEPIRGDGQIRILRVLHRDSEEVADLIRGLSESSGGSVGGAEDSVAAAAAATELSGADYTIVVDKPTRSLVVRADPETHLAIRDVLEVLDKQPQLIAIDLTISELRMPETFGLGFGFSVPISQGNNVGDLQALVASDPGSAVPGSESRVFGRVQNDTGITVSVPSPDGTGTIVVPVRYSGEISYANTQIHNEVLVQPHLVVTTGERHEIFVGDNLPVPVSDQANLDNLTSATTLSEAVSAVARTTTIERTDVGVELGIEVRAGEDGKIAVELEVELSTVRFDELAGPIEVVGPSFATRNLTVNARLDDGQTAVVAGFREKDVKEFAGGIPFLRDLPFFGWIFGAKGHTVEDVRLAIAIEARRVSSPSELAADTIRRRLTFERAAAREIAQPSYDESPFGVRVTTRSVEDDAQAIVESLRLKGLSAKTHRWSFAGETYYDVYVVELESMVDAAEIASGLSDEGWDADLMVFSKRS